MTFPESSRIHFRNNTLDKVICQLRFPPILKIDAESPVDFQELVRASFPGYEESAGIVLADQPRALEIPPDVLSSLGAGKKNYKFISVDQEWNINLTNNFIALSTSKYQRWETFLEKLQAPVQALIEIYKPDYFSRIGLRYINIISRSSLGIENDWSELLQPYICGILCASDVSESVSSFENRSDFSLSDGVSQARLFTRYVTAEDSEPKYMIDADYFIDKNTQLNDWSAKVGFFKENASNLFQWCITPTLYEAMNPEPLE